MKKPRHNNKIYFIDSNPRRNENIEDILATEKDIDYSDEMISVFE
jgi:hypothetical protein